MDLLALLEHLPGLYESLEDASLPIRTGEPSDRSPDPREKPAPGRLDVIEHRHELVRGLRWWVDAVHPKDGRVPRVGQDVPAMCAVLARAVPVMDPEDRETLRVNLQTWRARAWGMVDPGPLDKGDLGPVNLPPEAFGRVVQVKDAAAILGCTVRTVQRRVPVAERPGGMVLLGDVWRCEHCDLRWRECAHTRS